MVLNEFSRDHKHGSGRFIHAVEQSERSKWAVKAIVQLEFLNNLDAYLGNLNSPWSNSFLSSIWLKSTPNDLEARPEMAPIHPKWLDASYFLDWLSQSRFLKYRFFYFAIFA